MISEVQEMLKAGHKARQALTRRIGYFLIVEDDKSIAEMLLRIIEKHGLKGRIVNTAEGALKIIKAEPKAVRCAIIDVTEAHDMGDELRDIADALVELRMPGWGIVNYAWIGDRVG